MSDRSLGVGGRAVVPLWGVLGVLLLLVQASVRLGQVVAEALHGPSLTWAQLGLTAAWLAFMAYFEGYRGFQKAFAPRVVARALLLADRPRPLHAALAPLFCMGLIHATRRRIATSWAVLLGIVALVALMRLVPQPYRGLVDSGVLVGLVWGTVSVLGSFARALSGAPPEVSTDLHAPRPPRGDNRPADGSRP